MNAKISIITVLAAMILLLTIGVASATVLVNNQFVEAQYDLNHNLIYTNTPVNNVSAIGFVCADATCSQVSGQIFGGQTLNSGSTNTLQTSFPTQAQYSGNNGYAVFYYKDGYITYENNPTYFGSGTVAGTITRPLTKIQTCSAPIDTFSVINDVYPNQPIMVDISASADATVRNIFSQNGPIGYVPPSIAALNNLQVQVTLDIMNSAGQVVSTQVQNVTLQPSGSVQVQFAYTPTIVDRYTARISTKVVDNKCLSTDVQFSQKNFNVIQQGPTNQCYTLLNNLAITPINQTTNSPVNLSVDKISNYYDSNGNLFPIATLLSFTIQQNGQTIAPLQLNVAANADSSTPQRVNFQLFTPRNSGYYTVTVSGAALNCPFNSNNTADTVSQQFYIATPNSTIITNGTNSTNTTPNSAPQFSQIPDVALFYNQGLVNNLFNVNNFATDADGDAMTFSLVSQSNTGVISCSLAQNGSVSCTTISNQVGCSTVTIGASDGKVTSNSNFQACTLAANNAPIFSQLPNVVLPTGNIGPYVNSVVLSQYAFDPDGQALTFAVVTQTNPSVANCVINFGNLVCTGVQNASGFSDVRVVANDGSLTASSQFRITVVNQNTTPSSLNLSGIPNFLLQANSGLNQNLVNLLQFTSNPQNHIISYQILGQTNPSAVACSLTIANTVNCNVKPNIQNQFSDITVAVTDGIVQIPDTFRVSIGQFGGVNGTTCVGPNNTTISNSASVTYFQSAIAPFGGSCVSQQRTCTNGVLSGNFTFATCNVTAGLSCIGPNGATILDGTNATYFQFAIVPIGSSCVSQTRTCNNGVLSGSYLAASCIVGNNTPPVWTQNPTLNILRNAGSGSVDMRLDVFDPEVPPQILSFTIDSAMTSYANQTAVQSCSIAFGSSVLSCTTNHGQDGHVVVYVNVSDGINSTQSAVDVTVGIRKVSTMPKAKDGLRIMQFIVPDVSVGQLSNDNLPITLSLSNDGRHLTDVSITATILELGLQTTAGPFDVGSSAKEIQLYLPIEANIMPGVYTVQLAISDKTNGLNRIEYRDLVVYPGN